MDSTPHSLSVFHCEPDLITDFDDSDLSEHIGSSVNINGARDATQVVPLVRQSVLIGSLLEQLCSLYEADKKKSHRLYYILCDQLAKLGIVSPVAYLHEFTSVRSQYKAVLYNIIQSSILKIDNDIVFHEGNNMQMQDPKETIAGRKPRIIDPGKVFDFDVSRYKNEFFEKEKLGTGGYGNVFCVQSKIDGQEYAMKKIILSSSFSHGDNNDSLLREVRVLATLHHNNIVRYHSAWIEHDQEHAKGQSGEKSDQKLFTQQERNSENGYSVNRFLHSRSEQIDPVEEDSYSSLWNSSLPLPASSNSSVKKGKSKFWDDVSDSSVSNSTQNGRKTKTVFSISPQNSDDEDFSFDDSHKPSGDHHVQFKPQCDEMSDEVILTHGVRRDIDMRRVKSFVILKDSNVNESIPAFEDRTKRTLSLCSLQSQNGGNEAAIMHIPKNALQVSQAILQDRLVLFIQMQLCQMTLKQWLTVRNRGILRDSKSVRKEIVLHIMKQILKALEFIHLKDLIHRDVKPPNIFVNNTDRPHILLGDFGLAKADVDSEEPIPPLVSHGEKPHLRRKNSQTHTSRIGTTTYAAPEQLTEDYYDSKVDLYSFGIVAYELWRPFSTAMERADHLNMLRHHSIPLDFREKFPEQADLIHNLLDHNPAKRSSASDILQSNFFDKSKDLIIKEQRLKIEKLEKENEILIERLKTVGK